MFDFQEDDFSALDEVSNRLQLTKAAIARLAIRDWLANKSTILTSDILTTETK